MSYYFAQAAVAASDPSFGSEATCTAPGGAGGRWQETADGTTEITITTAMAAGGRVVILAMMQSATQTLASAIDSRGNTYAVDVERRYETSNYVAIISAQVATALQSGDVITLTWGSDAYSYRSGSVCYLANTTAGAADMTGSNSTYGTAVTVTGTTTAATAIVGILVNLGASATYSGGNWTTIGTYTDYGSRRSYFMQTAVAAGAQDPGGTWSANDSWGSVWAAYK